MNEMMNSVGSKTKKVSRPTEEKALALIAKEALRRGITQVEMFNRFITHGRTGTCHCPYCRRKRAMVI